MEYKDKVVVITGGAQGIGKCIADEFRKSGAHVCVIDKSPLPSSSALTSEAAKPSAPREGEDYFQGDISQKDVLEAFANSVITNYGHVDYIINNALPIMRGIDECTYEEFLYAQQVGVIAPFYLVKLLKDSLAPGASIVNISSSRDRMSQPQTESYSAAKGGIAALTHSLAVSLAGKARVNSISPGWIVTTPSPRGARLCRFARQGRRRWEGADGPDATQQPAGRVGNPLDIANMVLFLCSDKAGFITGENICIDGGMTKLMIYHGDNGWSFNDR